MMLITPLTAFAPHSVPPGPDTTSIRSTSCSSVSCTSQKTPANSGEYTLRPSTSTRSLFDRSLVKPRIEIVHSLEPLRATSTPGASRSASGILVTPLRRMSSAVMT
jgi:hypothetical protein